MEKLNLITDDMKDLVTKQIARLLNNEIEELSIVGLSASAFKSILKGFDCEVNDDLDINGWECDYWYSFIHKNKKYNVSGTAWEGSINISKEEN